MKLRIWLGGVFSLLVLAGLLLANVLADSSSPWLTNSNLNLQKQAEVSAPPESLNGNIDCQMADAAHCVIPTAYGSANSSAEVQLNGTSSYQPVISYIDNHQSIIAIPSSSTVISYTTEQSSGFHLYFNYNFSSSIKISNPGSGVQYQINKAPDGKLADADGHLLAADYSSMSFSKNGQWMVVSQPNVALLRVNLQTFEVTPFGPGFNYTIGLGPALQTAITDDGRYAVVASKNFGTFKLYDLSTCGSVPSTISGPVACQSRDLQSFMGQQLSGYINASNIRFIDNETLGFYVTYTQGLFHKTAKFILSTSAGTASQLEYLALGDSYISGEGAYDYQTGTDTDDNTCHVSLLSYPYLLGHTLNYDSYHSAACSGAKTNDIIDLSGDYSGQSSPKIKRQDRTNQIEPILSNFQPGYIDQLDFVSTYQPKIITVSIGGNDIGFSSKLQTCLSLGTCYSTYEDRQEIVREINSKFNDFVDTYSQIKNAGAPDAKIYVIGYPQIAKVGGDCAENVHLDSDEVIFTQQTIDYLDSVIKAAAARADVDYVDTQNALDGHRLCEAGPGSVAVNGVTAGNDFPARLNGPIGRESYHPNAFGHELLEKAILSKTQNLTQAMPTADLSASLPPETGLAILNAPHSGRAISRLEFDPELSGNVLFKQSLNSISISGVAHSLQPLTIFQASLHSEPLALGSYSTDISGNLLAQLVIPDSVPAGYHTLHFYGSDITGQAIDIYKVIYVADSPTDWDGDGIPDASEACVGIAASGHDLDQDGIDDSCDPSIGSAPVTPAAATVKANTTTPISASGSTLSNTATPAAPHPTGQAQAPTPKVLADRISRPNPSNAPQQPELAIQATPPNPKTLGTAAGAAVFIAIIYAAWVFKGN